ncbi:TPA: hypothetical protein ACH3X1_016136 [Trebouxia sp. C0004]
MQKEDLKVLVDQTQFQRLGQELGLVRKANQDKGQAGDFAAFLATGEHEEYNTGAPLYSFFLADAFSMRAPYEQYGLYLALLTGGGFMANSFFKAFNLAKYVKYSQQQGYKKEAQYAADMAQVHPHELERAGRTVAKLRARGVATALAFPALWIAWRLVSHTLKKQLKDSHYVTKRIEPICIADGRTITLPHTVAGTS